ncbi:hypothetical protein J7E90_31700 [Streptomyces sp. ISL-111]|uniref:polymorphic toxin-type HINT domain-containing protein n=1 Tax=Streptomyces sp. ISL-111 TaxID=2819175 RepID=UPI001BE84C44|nr:polymorphic toxin-type HINT domain-containing protein [Streptomyces sp. ISL-111]MBT2381730.1 hypothetical protein [Streptomyces sp. ISL-111]
MHSTDPLSGESGPRRVTATIYTPDDREFTGITLKGTRGKTVLEATNHHPFWTPETQSWTNAGQLKAGDALRVADGTLAEIANVRRWKKVQPTYNLTVDDLHTYYVLASEKPVLVHNSSCTTVTSVINQDSLLTKAAQQSGKNQQVQRDFDHLFKQLSQGNMNPGKGGKALTGTDVTYARGQNGGRLFFRNVGGGVQIVGKSDKPNESKVIARLKAIYGK